MVQAFFEAGLVGTQDVSSIQVLSNAEAIAERQAAHARIRSLEELLGRHPEAAVDVAAHPPLPAPAPVGLPSKCLSVVLIFVRLKCGLRLLSIQCAGR